jgi:succinate--hydroxymethylglutarate CoA-transferase
VIKIERIDGGDDTRSWYGAPCTAQWAAVLAPERPVTSALAEGYPHPCRQPPAVKGESAYFLCVNRNKRSVAVDFTQPEGKALLHDLAAISDVFVENFIPGVLKSMQIPSHTAPHGLPIDMATWCRVWSGL